MDDFINRMAEGWGMKRKPMHVEKREHMADLKKRGFVQSIEKDTERNKDFRRVLYTGKHTQLVLMSLKPREEIGFEIHYGTDQFFRVESGKGMSVINGIRRPITAGSAIVVPSGARHNVINTGNTDLKLYTLYSPPHHADKIIRRTKAAAENPANKETFTGKTTE